MFCTEVGIRRTRLRNLNDSSLTFSLHVCKYVFRKFEKKRQLIKMHYE